VKAGWFLQIKKFLRLWRCGNAVIHLNVAMLFSRPKLVLANRGLSRFGYQLRRCNDGIGVDQWSDMLRLIDSKRPLVFDVGANAGQSINWFRRIFPASEIHSFEPSPRVFSTLKQNHGATPGVRLWNCALGSEPGKLLLNENTLSEWSSLLPLDHGWGKVERQTPVPIDTIDQFCARETIPQIDILKSDTQGYEMDVFRGAREMLNHGAIRLVYCEMIFSPQYTGQARFAEIYEFLVCHGFHLVSFYDIVHENGLASWTDGLFLHKEQ
jgi:FkbM family methyltransferase